MSRMYRKYENIWSIFTKDYKIFFYSFEESVRIKSWGLKLILLSRRRVLLKWTQKCPNNWSVNRVFRCLFWLRLSVMWSSITLEGLTPKVAKIAFCWALVSYVCHDMAYCQHIRALTTSDGRKYFWLTLTRIIPDSFSFPTSLMPFPSHLSNKIFN